VIVLDADVYDTLELSALEWGGIGARHYYDYGDNSPWCAIGQAHFAGIPITVPVPGSCVFGLIGGVITPAQSDAAVARIKRRCGGRVYDRVPFADWCAELGVVRGPHPEPEP